MDAHRHDGDARDGRTLTAESGEQPADSEASHLLGRLVAGKFRIESYLGGGGMGEVFRARWLELDQVVAIKVIRAGLATHQGFAARFKREAKAASQLDHPNSVRIIDFGVDG